MIDTFAVKDTLKKVKLKKKCLQYIKIMDQRLITRMYKELQ